MERHETRFEWMQGEPRPAKIAAAIPSRSDAKRRRFEREHRLESAAMHRSLPKRSQT